MISIMQIVLHNQSMLEWNIKIISRLGEVSYGFVSRKCSVSVCLNKLVSLNVALLCGHSSKKILNKFLFSHNICQKSNLKIYL